MSRDCVGSGECVTCIHSIPVATSIDRNLAYYICLVNDRIQYRCATCNKRTTANFNDPRVIKKQCKGCYNG